MTDRLMLDSNAIDPLLDDAAFLAAVVSAIATGRLALVVTHIQADELAEAKDPRRSALLAAIEVIGPANVSTAGFVLNVSRLDRAALFDDAGAARHDAFVGDTEGRRHTRAHDGLIIATAERERIPLVTDERRLGRVREHYPGVEILGIQALRDRVGVG